MYDLKYNFYFVVIGSIISYSIMEVHIEDSWSKTKSLEK